MNVSMPSGLFLSVDEELQLFRILARMDFSEVPPDEPLAVLRGRMADRAVYRDAVALNAKTKSP